MPYKDRQKQQEYCRAYNKNWYARNKVPRGEQKADRIRALRRWWHGYKSALCCVVCGENHPACLDFHHLNASEKEHDPGVMIGWGYSKERILQEVAKCIPLCANCHRKWHHDPEWCNGSTSDSGSED